MQVCVISQAGEFGSLGMKVKVVQLGDQDFRVEAEGLTKVNH